MTNVRITKSHFAYLSVEKEDTESFRYSVFSPDLLQHKLSNGNWADIWLGHEKKQLSLF